MANTTIITGFDNPDSIEDGYYFNGVERVHCTLNTCPLEYSAFAYVPSLPQNVALLALFSLSLFGFLVQGIWYRTWGFMIAMGLGTLTEVCGYAARIWSHNDVFSRDAFLMQYIALNLAPPFLLAGIYLTFSRIVILFGANLSPLKPNHYQWIFCTCDFISLCLQGLGGGISATAEFGSAALKRGDNIMISGIVAQVVSLGIFTVLAALFAYRVRENREQADQDPIKVQVRNSNRFRYFIYAIAAALLLITIRNVYRLAELSQGWNGYLISVQNYFFVFEALFVVLACLILNVFHPGLCFSAGYGRGAAITRKAGKASKEQDLA